MSSQRVDFSREQKDLITSDGSVFVEACPGAGKTQTIVQRFIERPQAVDPRRGIALLSFTNAAAEEARSRCAGAPQLVKAPNFIGTIDAFMNRFIVGPLFASQHLRAPQFCDSWTTVPRTDVTVGNRRVPLDWFALDLSGNARLDESRVPRGRRHEIQNLSASTRRRGDANAASLWRRLRSQGILSAETVRLKVAKYLEDTDTRRRHRELLAARFEEVIVDEVQDCAPADVSLLEFLLEAGIRLVLVGDPEQAIYGFRGADYSVTQRLTQSIPLGTRLGGNYRSSPAICKLVDSLRCSEERDRAVGRNAVVDTPIRVLTYRDPRDTGAQSRQILEAHGIPESQVVVLAHNRALSQTSAGVGGASGSTTNRLMRLASAFHDLQAKDANSRARAQALNTVQTVVRELNRMAELQSAPEAIFLQQQNLTLRSFRELCLRLAYSVPDPFSGPPSQLLGQLRALEWAKKELGWNPSRLQKPRGDRWPSRLRSSGSGLPNSTVHGFKGLQSPAVVLVIPKATQTLRNGVDCWEAGSPSEERRVLYVGASRAEKLLVLAVHEAIRGQVVGLLQRDDIPHLIHGSGAEAESQEEEFALT